MTKKPTLPRAAFVLGVLILSLGVGLRQGSADPILGQRIYYEGGPVELKILQGDAYYTSEVYLFSGNSPYLIGSSLEVGKVVNLPNLANLGVNVGDEFVLGILVTNTGDKFVTGPASANPDNFAHAIADYFDTPTGDVALFGFEDLWGGGDKDFNDVFVQARGGIGVVAPSIPEPLSLILLIVGLVGVFSVFRRKANES
jgi:hypothetical protein